MNNKSATVKFIKRFINQADIFLLAICFVASIFGVINIRYAVAVMGSPGKYIFVQLLSLFLGIIAFGVFTVLDVDILGEHWKWLVAINILLLVALVVFGQDDGTGNKSWIRFGGIGIQPSEFIKLFYIIVSAKHMTWLKEHRDINSFSSVLQMAVHFAVVFLAIVVISSDLGSATIVMFIFIGMFFALGVKLYWFAIGGAAVAAVIPLMWTYFLKDYQKKRLIAPYDPTIDPDGYGITWQTTQSKATLASGRLTGVEDGYTYSFFTGKHTDFIFASIGENFGMIGTLAVMLFLIVLIVHCARVGLHAGRTFEMLICIGIAASITWQTFINIGMCLGITPVIGITLPFMSYGGSSMLSMYMAVGIISGVKYKPKPTMYSLF